MTPIDSAVHFIGKFCQKYCRYGISAAGWLRLKLNEIGSFVTVARAEAIQAARTAP
jgi:hypothetical protein